MRKKCGQQSCTNLPDIFFIVGPFILYYFSSSQCKQGPLFISDYPCLVLDA